VDKASGDVVEGRVGTKRHEIVLDADGGTERREVDGERAESPSLAEAELRAVVDLVLAAERLHAFPQDVEWAVADDTVHILQSRPVTAFPPRWTRQESAERFPNPITPLTWDFTTAGFHDSLARSLDLMGLPPFRGEWFARLDGYIYGNQTAVEVYTAGHTARFDDLAELADRIPVLRERYRWVQELPLEWARDLDRYLLALGRLEATPLDSLDLQDLWEHTLEVDRVGREYFLPNIAISITQGLLHRLLFQIVAHVVGPEAAPAVYDGLTCFCETKTSVVNRDLHALAELARADEPLRQALVSEDRRTLVERGTVDAHPEFASAFARFLGVHGHREVDFDAYHPTWVGQPWVVLENVRLLLLRDDLPDPGAAEQEARIRQQVTEREFLARVPDEIRTFVGEVARLARTYTALDDLEHYQTTRLTPPFRSALLEIGKRLVDAGALERPSDVFFLRRETLEGVVEGRVSDDDAWTESLRNREEHERQLASDPAHVWGQTEDGAGAGAADSADGALRGLPGAPGVAEGPVCLVHTVEDFARFQPGDVLVAPTTNPAWTPLFYTAAAVVTESGGPLSHGAVTAREVRIPAVMGVRGAMGVLRDGERVTVDGTRGVVGRGYRPGGYRPGS
jgi:pyruvate,water dikinase